MRGFYRKFQLVSGILTTGKPLHEELGMENAHLRALLASTSLTLGVGHGGDLLTGGLGGRLSLRKEDQSSIPPTN